MDNSSLNKGYIINPVIPVSKKYNANQYYDWRFILCIPIAITVINTINVIRITKAACDIDLLFYL